MRLSQNSIYCFEYAFSLVIFVDALTIELALLLIIKSLEPNRLEILDLHVISCSELFEIHLFVEIICNKRDSNTLGWYIFL